MKALIAVDIQNDFCPGGALAVPDGDRVIPVINRLAEKFDHMILTQDWHPADHISFASSYPDKNPYETIEVSYGEQVLWPDHCVQNTRGAEFHPDLRTEKVEVIIRKGFRREIDSYSAFFENDQKTRTGLKGYLQERGIRELYFTGLATDFCVRWSVIDASREGFKCYVFQDGVRGIDLDGSVEQAWKEMREAGATLLTSDQF